MTLLASRLEYVVDGRALLRDVSLRVEPGQVHAVLGPNGAGKSTLLKLLSGDLQPASGSITCAGRALGDWSPGELARLRAVLPQRDQLSFGFTVEEVVGLGRLPCPRHVPGREQQIILAAMQAAGVDYLRTRRYPTLSGGERTRTQLARVLAQIWEPVDLGTRLLMLDEPTASLDLAHQHRCLRVARDFAAREIGVLVVLHDPNLVLAYADAVTLLCCGEVAGQGAPKDVLSADRLARVYGVPVDVVDHAEQPWVRVAHERIDAAQ